MSQIKADFFNLVNGTYMTHHADGETWEDFFMIIAKRSLFTLTASI